MRVPVWPVNHDLNTGHFGPLNDIKLLLKVIISTVVSVIHVICLRFCVGVAMIFGSIPLNKSESHYSQAKLELYGLFKAFQAYRLYPIGVKKLLVEVNAFYIKGTLNEPDLQ